MCVREALAHKVSDASTTHRRPQAMGVKMLRKQTIFFNKVQLAAMSVVSMTLAKISIPLKVEIFILLTLKITFNEKTKF